MQSGMGVLKAQSFYTDKNKPFGDGPKSLKGNVTVYLNLQTLKYKTNNEKNVLITSKI